MAKDKIEFIDGEPYLRYNGNMMSPEKCIEVFGTDIEIYSEDFIEWEDGTLYTDLSFPEIIKNLAYKETFKEKEYDEVLSNGYYGFNSYCKDKEIENSYILNKDTVNSIKSIKPLKEFKKEHPNIKVKKIVKFCRAIDEYYNNRH